jgi:hypothetical protein
MKRPHIQQPKRPERSPEQLQLLGFIRDKFQEVEYLRSMRKRMDGKIGQIEDDKLQMYLIIAHNSLAESQSIMASKGLAEAQKRFELAMNELRFAREIIEHHHEGVEFP